MKQVLSIKKALIVSDFAITAIDHPTTIFTDDIVSVDLFDDQLIIDRFSSKQVDDSLISIAQARLYVPLIHLENQPRTTNSDSAVEQLVELGSTIITIDR